MRWSLSLLVAAPLLGLLAQTSPQTSATPAAPQPANASQPCREDRSVDEYIAELNKAKKQRNKNPLPNSLCIGGWCKGSSAGKPEARPAPPPPPSTGETRSSESSSKQAAEPAATYDPFQAAQSVEVGDYYFSQKKYRAALSRYQEAFESKPDDPAILLRLARAFEELDEPTRAFESYDAALVAGPAAPSAGEAGKSAERLRPEVKKRGDDPDAISARNRARIVPQCRTAAPEKSPPASSQ
jgi:tetratricopeptide (TPR) repeat protein